MNKFSDAYAKANTALKGGKLAGSAKGIQKELLSLLAGAGGPDAAHSAQLDKLRAGIAKDAKSLASKGTNPLAAHGKAVVASAGDGTGIHERAATVKMLNHLYLQRSTGGQQVWVYSPPEAYAKWLFDEVAGATATALETSMSKNGKEVYSESQRGVMAAALQEARTVALGVLVKLGAASDATRGVVRRYFGNAATTDKELIDTMVTLAAGYKKIANACNGTNVIISDEPGDRTGGGWKDWAFIYTTEAMSVIYLQGAWLKKADEITPSNQSPLYRCVRTIIHELSHKEVSTEDVVYGPKGLKPEGSGALTPAHALHNADSWAYFAVDVLGLLTGPDKANGDTSTSAILKVPTRTLTV